MKKLNNKGITLIELLVALAIVSLGVITMFTAVDSNLKVNTKNDKDIKSLQIAQSEIESLRSQIKFKSPSVLKINVYNKDENKEEVVEKNIDELKQEFQYPKIIDNKSNIYIVKLIVTEDDADLYTIDVKVSSDNKDFSSKSTNIVTKIFGK